MSDEVDTVVERVRERVEPDDDERARLESVVEELTAPAEAAFAGLPVEADVVLAGSTARETWLAGERDVDLFVRLPPDLDREQLREYGLTVGHAVVDGREEYAEHPYVVGELDGFGVDVVPCYALDDATEIRSAVDRTPFHTRYVRDRLDRERASDVRVAKQFLTGIGVYGSDLRTRGFSGYLTALLVLEYGGFRELLAATLRPGSVGSITTSASSKVSAPWSRCSRRPISLGSSTSRVTCSPTPVRRCSTGPSATRSTTSASASGSRTAEPHRWRSV